MATIGKPSNNIMITSIDKIPVKQNGQAITDDMNDDPIVRDVLSEFEKELAMTTGNNNYQINYDPQQQPQQPQQSQPLPQQPQPPQPLPQQPLPPQQQMKIAKKQDLYIDNEIIVKVFIICIVVALITNPYIYSTILSKVPENISMLLDNYNYFIKLILIFIILYLLIFYKCV
jgi:hypothetical protein